MTTTCQICGRNIKANTGIIAHHGYTRPFDGFQTSSCYGARTLPYEKDCRVLARYIEMLDSLIERKQAVIADIEANPSAVLRVRDRRRSAQRGTTVLMEISPNDRNYFAARMNHLSMLRGDLSQTERERRLSQERLEAWVPPQA